jgi:pimeloyl-ACP methyl ester carboxylesterase
MECGWFVAPEVRSKPEGRVVRLPVVVLRATEPDGSPPLVMLHGGPGGPGGVLVYTPQVARGPIRQHRDVVIYDQRGAGLSEPKLCPQHADSLTRNQWLDSDDDRQEFWDAFARSCVALLRSQGIDPAAYNTTTHGEDLVDLRRALSYAKWDVYGGSYGGRLAQEGMRRDPDGIRSVVLASSITRGPTTHIEESLVTQRAFEHIFVACASKPTCHQAFPTLEADFYALYDELERNPLVVRIERDSAADSVLLDGRRLVNRLRQAINRNRRRFPLLVLELRSGDRMRAARMLVGDGEQGYAYDAQVLNNLVHCYDEYSPAFQPAADSVDATLRPPFRRKSNRSDCLIWLDRFADSADRAPVRSAIPTLVLNGYFDDRTPPEHGKLIAATLSRAYVYVFPNEGHGNRPLGCHEAIIQQFYQDPLKEPDASCIERIPSWEFITGWDHLTPVPSP